MMNTTTQPQSNVSHPPIVKNGTKKPASARKKTMRLNAGKKAQVDPVIALWNLYKEKFHEHKIFMQNGGDARVANNMEDEVVNILSKFEDTVAKTFEGLCLQMEHFAKESRTYPDDSYFRFSMSKTIISGLANHIEVP